MLALDVFKFLVLLPVILRAPKISWLMHVCNHDPLKLIAAVSKLVM